MIAKIPTMNTSVGPISTLADSAIPTRLITVEHGESRYA